MFVPGYLLREPLYFDGHLSIHRALREADGAQVVVKSAWRNDGAADDSLRRDFEISQTLSLGCVLYPSAFFRLGQASVTVFQGWEFLPLVARTWPLPVHELWSVAFALLDAIAAFHAEGMVHGALCPRSLWQAVDGGPVKLSDLGFALARGQRKTMNIASRLETRDLPFLAPERTGFLDIPAGFSTDFYSLGAVFFWMIFGEAPFSGTSRDSLIHKILAESIKTSFEKFDRGIPRSLGAVIEKMMAKEPASRYQTHQAIRRDLEACRRIVRESAHDRQFSPGRFEPGLPRLHLSEGCCREREKERLRRAFEEVSLSRRSAIALVQGEPGIGKTALLKCLESERRSTGDLAFLVGARQVAEKTPYFAISLALSRFIKAMLGAHGARFEARFEDMRAAVGPNAAILCRVVPETELIFGRLAEPREFSLSDDEGRIHLALASFLASAFLEETNVAFLFDDVQWMDPASLRALKSLLKNTRRLPILFVLASRAVSGNMPEAVALVKAQLEEDGIVFLDVPLSPMEAGEVRGLIASAMECEERDVTPFSEQISRRTQGNPLHVFQLLRFLEQESLLKYENDSSSWRWNGVLVSELMGGHGDLFSLLERKIETLTPASRDVLAFLSCLGAAIPADALELLADSAGNALAKATTELADVGLIEMSQEGMLAISHDRIRETSLARLDPIERSGIHLRIARRLRQLSGESDERLFDVAAHYNAALPAVVDRAEALEAARIDLEAGRKARFAAAYENALAFFEGGLRALGQTGWQDNCQLAFDLGIEAAECRFLGKRLEEADASARELLEHELELSQQARAYRLRLEILTLKEQLAEAVALGRECLAKLGFALPEELFPEDLAGITCRVTPYFSDDGIQLLKRLESMRDPIALGVAEVLSVLMSIFFHLDYRFLVYSSRALVLLAAKFGKSPPLFFTLAVVAHSLAEEGNTTDAQRLMGFVSEWLEQEKDLRYRTKVANVLGLGSVWMGNPRSGIRFFSEAVESAKFSGDLIWASYAAFNLLHSLLVSGENLETVMRETEKNMAVFEMACFEPYVVLMRTFLQLVKSLTGRTKSLTEFDDAEYSLTDVELRVSREWPGSFIDVTHHFYRLQCFVFAQNYSDAIRSVERIEAYRERIEKMGALVTQFVVFAGLAFAGELLMESGAPRQAEHLAHFLKYRSEMEALAARNQENGRHKILLLNGLAAFFRGELKDSLASLNSASQAALKEGFWQFHAISEELMARICMKQGIPFEGLARLERARSGYADWGAVGKWREVQNEVETLSRNLRERFPRSAFPEPELSSDMIAVVRALREISREIVPENLIRSLFQTLMFYSGASKIALTFEGEEGSRLVALASLSAHGPRTEVFLEQSQKEQTGALVPWSVLAYARLLKKSVLLNGPLGLEHFRADAYFQENSPLSVFCVPLLRKESVQAVLYLENREIAGVFNERRIEVLELIASQTAVSLENALLYARLRESERKLRSILLHISDAVIVCSDERKVILTNPAGREMLRIPEGAPPEPDLESVAQECFFRVDGTPFSEQDCPFMRALEGESVEQEDVLVRKHGESDVWFFAQVSSSPIRDEDGKITGSVTIARDVTERREMEKHKDQFLRVCAHELKTPIAVLKGYVQLLLRTKEVLNAKTAWQLSVVEERAEELSRLVQRMLDANLIQLGHMTLVREKIELSELVQDEIERLKPGLGAHAVHFVSQGSAWVCADKARVAQVVENLLTNAVKFSPQGGEVGVSILPVGGEVVVSVSDAGVGIPQERQKHIFRCFYRAHTDTAFDFNGMGVGLFLAFEIVNLLGGRMWFESREGQGSTFHFALPLADAGERNSPY